MIKDMNPKHFRFEDWQNHTLVDSHIYHVPTHPDVYDPAIKDSPLHAVMMSIYAQKVLVDGGYLPEEELKKIRTAQREAVSFLEDYHMKEAEERISHQEGNAEQSLDFFKQLKSRLDHQEKVNCKLYPGLTEQVYAGESFIHLLDPDAYTELLNLKNSNREPVSLKVMEPPEEFLPLLATYEHRKGYTETITVHRSMLQTMIEFKVLLDEVSQINKILGIDDAEETKPGEQIVRVNRQQRRGRSEKKILMGDDFYKEANRLYNLGGPNSPISRVNPNNPSDWLTGELAKKEFVGYRVEDEDKNDPIKVRNTSTIKRALVGELVEGVGENLKKWKF